MIQSITSAIHLALSLDSADFALRSGTRQSAAAGQPSGAPVQYTPPARPLVTVNKTIEAVQAAVHITPLMHPMGFLASAFTGPQIETTDARSFSVPQLLAHAAVSSVEKNHAHFTRDPVYTPPTHIASWGELAQRVAPSKESLLEGAFLLITKGKKPGPLLGAKRGTTSLKAVRDQVAQAEAKLKDQRDLLEQTKRELSVFEAKPTEFAEQVTQRQNWISSLEKTIAAQEKALQSLRGQEARLSTSVPSKGERK